LIAARETVFITDWWISPENYLLRPAGEVYSFLDANNGVDILLGF